jgi:protoporphyrinogen oxidase
MELGHGIRDAEFRPAERFEPVDVIIVGGGVAGLSAAWRLSGAGFQDYLVLETEQSPGGTSRWGSNGVSEFPWAAHYVPAPTRDTRALVRLLDEAGVIEGYDAQGEPLFGEQYLVRTPEERIHEQGQWWEGLYLHAGSTAEEVRQYRSFFADVDRWSSWKDAKGCRAFNLPRSKGSMDPEVRALDGISFAQWLDERGYDSPRLRWFLDYACRDDYGARLDTTSAWAGLFYFAARKQGPGEESRPILAWPEGNGFLVKALSANCKDRLRLHHPVIRMETEPHGRIRVHAWNVEEKRTVGWLAKHVIFAGPMLVAPRVMPELAAQRPGIYPQFLPSTWLVANLTLRNRPKEGSFPLAWDNVIKDSPSLGYVVATHQSCKDYGPSVWTYYRAFAGSDLRADWARIQAMDWKACARMVLEDLHKVHPDLKSCLARMDIMRWAHAMVRPRPGFLFSEAMRIAREPFKGVHFAHTDLSGFALFEEAQDHGLRAAEEVLAVLGKHSPTWR